MFWETIFPTQVATCCGAAGSSADCGGIAGGTCFVVVLFGFRLRISYEAACRSPSISASFQTFRPRW